MLQGGRPSIETVSSVTGAAEIGDITFAAGFDFVALFEDSDTCSFWYMAQGSGVSTPGLRYETATGAITSVTEL